MPNDPFIDPARLSSLGPVRYLDARDQAAFDAGHAPNAVRAPVDAWDKAIKTADIGFGQTAFWAEALGSLGVGPDVTAVTYDAGGMTNAARVWFVLEFFGIPCLRVAEARRGSTWVYRFDYPTPADNHQLGACHGAEVPFVFDTAAREDVRALIGDGPAQDVADTMHRVWIDFITTGDPGWARYEPTTRTTGLLAHGVNAVDDPAGDERACWDGIRLRSPGFSG